MGGKAGASPGSSSALAEYFHCEVRGIDAGGGGGGGGDKAKARPRKRRRHRSRSFSARAEGIQNALLATRLGPLMHEDGFTRQWKSAASAPPGRQARVVVRRRAMLTKKRRKAARMARVKAKDEPKEAEWGDSDKENQAPNGDGPTRRA